MNLARFFGAARAAARLNAPPAAPVVDAALARFVATLERLEAEARRKPAPRAAGAGRIRALDLGPLHSRDP